MNEPMSQEQADRLIQEVRGLAARIQLSEDLATQAKTTSAKADRATADARRISERNNKLFKVIVGGLIMVILLVIGLGYTSWQAHQTAEALRETQKTNCENANKTREAQTYLWDTIIAQSQARRDPGEPPPTPQEEKYLKNFQAFIHEIFAERDCENLDKEYPLPDPPAIPGQ